MEIDFVAIISFDYVESTQEEKVIESLSNMYNREPDSYGGPTLGGGSWSHRVFGNHDKNPLEEESDFKWIRTKVEKNTWGIIDVVSIAILSEKQISNVLTEENGPYSEFANIRRRFVELISDVPSIVPENKGLMCYVGPETELEIRSDERIDVEKAQESLESNGDVLNRFGFTTAGYISLLKGNVFVAPNILLQPWDRITAVSRDISQDEVAPNEFTMDPSWYRGVDEFQMYLQAYYWSEYMSDELQSIDNRVEKRRDELTDYSENQPEIDSIIKVAEKVQTLRIDWVELRSTFIDSLHQLRRDFEQQSEERIGPFSVPYDTPIPKTTKSGLVFGEDESNSLINRYENEIQNRLEFLESNSDRIGKKHNMLIESIGDLINTSSTRENINLQKDVKDLTKILTWLTVILVFLTVIMAVQPFLMG